MRSLLVCSIFSLALTSCQQQEKKKPVWENQTAVITVPIQNLRFSSTGKNWSAQLLSFVQPVGLTIRYTDSGFVVSQSDKMGMIEGPAQLHLTDGDQHYYYNVALINKSTGAIIKKDYRSPKTVNPDSSLLQHQMVHDMDQWRNLVCLGATNAYFTETDRPITTKVGVYQAQPGQPLSSYYVQPGSCTTIPLTASFDIPKKQFVVNAGPLTDKFDNTVANGTAVVFSYSDGEKTYQQEVTLLDGMARIYVPADAAKTYTLMATVHRTQSRAIQLKQP